ncbi:MAG TPA: V-type ATP synthase subunit D [Nitrososphaerales archaeon]|nr:V-type ATP synthase subunit D [Nitrososphaerales archaeon]
MSARDAVKPTRMELLRLKARIKLANKGLNLLKQKRAALIAEFFKINKKALNLRKQLNESMKKSYSSLSIAEMYHGKIAMESTAYMVNRMKGLSIQTKNVMGVKIPELAGRDENFRAIDQQYALMGLSVKSDETIINFESSLKTVLDIAEVENSLRRILVEIDKTKRRVNSIENVLVPRLQGQAKYISMRFDEMERETFVTLKTIKAKLAKE